MLTEVVYNDNIIDALQSLGMGWGNRANLDSLRAVRDVRHEQVQSHTTSIKTGMQIVNERDMISGIKHRRLFQENNGSSFTLYNKNMKFTTMQFQLSDEVFRLVDTLKFIRNDMVI